MAIGTLMKSYRDPYMDDYEQRILAEEYKQIRYMKEAQLRNVGMSPTATHPTQPKENLNLLLLGN